MPNRVHYGLMISFLMFLGLLTYGSAVKSVSYNIQESSRFTSKEASKSQIKNIILMIGDGMGFEQVKLGRWVELGNGSGSLSMEQLPFWLNVTTHSADAEITDSAAGATALATGTKTDNGVVALDPSGNTLKTILETARDLGKATGVVTTTEVTHATPASFITHVADRNNYEEIAGQIAETTPADVILGGGYSDFSMTQRAMLESKGYAIITNRSSLLGAQATPILGFFSISGHMRYETDRNFTSVPSILEMTEKAIDLLASDSDGFFLMVEGGRIDHAGHSNDQVKNALETIAFDRAVRFAHSFAQTQGNTLVIVTADHETGGLSVTSENQSSLLPAAEMTAEANRTLRMERANNITVTWSTTGHTSADVPFFGYGSEFSSFANRTIIDNTEIFHMMNSSLETTALTSSSESEENGSSSPGFGFPLAIASLIGIAAIGLKFRKN